MKARGGTDVEDCAPAARHHLRNRAGAQVDDRLDVDPHLCDLGIHRRVADRAHRSDACVVHEDVDGETTLGGLVEQRGASTRVRNVANKYFDPDGASKFSGQLVQLSSRRATRVTP